ncbi:hypothetical protein GCM10009745_32440 [Kribbella yunnanensis]|uniref:DUF2273 domain-containing protein n=1 Tax=Kribbella yunnanensis TaxID=190194 RepID=A0ABN2HC90_9ACTN
MIFAISGLFIFAALGFFLLMRMSANGIHAVVFFLFGYFVAKSQYSPFVQDLLSKFGGQ